MSRCVYDGLSLPWCRTESIDSEVITNNGDYVHTKITATIDSTIAKGTPGLFLTGESLAECLARIRHKLEAPRKAFRFEMDGEPVIDSSPDLDTGNGPFPEVVSVHNVVGTESAVLRFRVTTYLRQCPDGEGEAPIFLSHRWRESADLGDDFRTVRRRSGMLILRANAKRDGRPLDADELRWLVVPPVPDGFMFRSGHFDVSEDRNHYSYDIEHVEVDEGGMPPPPAVKASGNCVINTPNGARFHAAVTVRLTGHPKTSKAALMQTAVAVAMERLERAGPERDDEGRAKITLQMSEDLYRNEVEIQLRTILDLQQHRTAELSGGRSPTQGLGGVGSITGIGGLVGRAILREANKRPGDKPPPGPEGDLDLAPKGVTMFGVGGKALYSDPGQAPDPGLRATAGLKIIAAILNQPCEQSAALRGDPKGYPRGAELTASAPAADKTRLPAGTALRSGLTVNVVPDLDEILRRRRERLNQKIPGRGYSEYRLFLRFRDDPNMSAMAEQREGGLTRFVQLAAETVTLRVEWSAERVGSPPVIPKKDLGDDNAVFLGGEYDPGDADLSADGVTLIWRSAGWWEFGFKDPSKVKRGAGISPWLAALIGHPPEPVVYGGPEVIETERVAELRAGGPPPAAGVESSRWRQLWDRWASLFRPPNR